MEFWQHNMDYIGLSTEEKPSENLVNGTTLYEVDTGNFYIYYKENWYLQGENNSESTNNAEDGEE